MPAYTDPYISVRRIEKDIYAISGKQVSFKYEKDAKFRTHVVVYYTHDGETTRLTSFDTLDDAEDFAKVAVNYYEFGHQGRAKATKSGVN